MSDRVAIHQHFAMGDPQTTRERLLRVLDRHGLLDEDGRLRRDATLVSIGDHFDFGTGDPGAIGREGLANLRFLASHSPDQVILLAGNHDLARVMELRLETDATFARARALSLEILAREGRGEDTSALTARFAAEFPSIPTPQIARRDYGSYSEEQRSLVASLLLEGRMKLAHVAKLHSGERVLLTHAGVTTRELEILGLSDEADASQIAEALNAFLARAVDRVRAAWAAFDWVRLDLDPLHVGGTGGREGGGLLYHRPADPKRAGADRAWEFDARAPRRFDPRTLPRGLVQACGHSGHKKNRKELAAWVGSSSEHDEGCLRTLIAGKDRVVYETGVHPPHPDEATLYLIDAEMNLTDPDRYDLLPLAAS